MPDDDDVTEPLDAADSDDSVVPSHAVRNTLAVVFGTFAVLLAVWLVLVVLDRSDLQSDADRREDIETVAGDFASTLLSYDYADIDATVDDVDRLVTDGLREELATGYQGDLREQIEQLQAVSTAEVLDVLVSDTTGDTSRAIVVVQTEVRSETSQARVTTYLDLSLLRVDGTWLVDELEALRTEGGLVDEDGDPVPTPSTSSIPTSSVPSSVPEDTEEEPAGGE